MAIYYKISYPYQHGKLCCNARLNPWQAIEAIVEEVFLAVKQEGDAAISSLHQTV